jgi:hypothetical protein
VAFICRVEQTLWKDIERNISGWEPQERDLTPMDDTEIKKRDHGRVQNYQLLPIGYRHKYSYEVGGRIFDSKKPAEEYREWLVRMREKLQYKKPTKEVEQFFSSFHTWGDTYDAEESFWCNISSMDDWRTLTEYLYKRHTLTAEKPFPECARFGWHYVSFVDWDDGDYDNWKESWSLIIVDPKTVYEKIKAIIEGVPIDKKGLRGISVSISPDLRMPREQVGKTSFMGPNAFRIAWMEMFGEEGVTEECTDTQPQTPSCKSSSESNSVGPSASNERTEPSESN